MVKDLFLASRSQTQKNTEKIGGLKIQIAKLEKDVAAAHAAIREMKNQPRERER
jgi:hypothetical protein